MKAFFLRKSVFPENPESLDVRQTADDDRKSIPLNAAFRDFSFTGSWKTHVPAFSRFFTPERMLAASAHTASEYTMLNWIITFFLMAIAASVLGFGGLAGTFDSVAQFLAILFVFLFIASLIFSIISSRRPPPPLP